MKKPAHDNPSVMKKENCYLFQGLQEERKGA